tara:strand:- start:206 stop:601 length:396 start_codon:yes stop_codon:yes gene_type:complete
MKKIFILLSTLFLLVGCIESIAVLGGGGANGKVIQSSLQSGVSYGIKKKTGKTPLGHALNYVKQKEISKKKGSCSSFNNKKDLEICLMVNERIKTNQVKITKKESSSKSLIELTSSLRSSINQKYKIKYLD